MNLELLQQIRGRELERALAWMPPSGSILEIGAGAGWQSKELSQRGFEVRAIDVATSRYRGVQVWPVEEYDGRRIPFPDAQFDTVFSSNVLEHVLHLEDLQREIGRVLKPGGRGIHVLPSSSWRLWTIAAHYPHVARSRLLKLLELLRQVARPEPPRSSDTASGGRRVALYRALILVAKTPRRLLPPRHGERGNAFSEVWTFSRFAWRKFFRRTGWKIVHCAPAGIFYSGHLLLGRLLAVEQRRSLSAVFGSSCILYVLEPDRSGERAPCSATATSSSY